MEARPRPSLTASPSALPMTTASPLTSSSHLPTVSPSPTRMTKSREPRIQTSIQQSTPLACSKGTTALQLPTPSESTVASLTLLNADSNLVSEMSSQLLPRPICTLASRNVAPMQSVRVSIILSRVSQFSFTATSQVPKH